MNSAQIWTCACADQQIVNAIALIILILIKVGAEPEFDRRNTGWHSNRDRSRLLIPNSGVTESESPWRSAVLGGDGPGETVVGSRGVHYAYTSSEDGREC